MIVHPSFFEHWKTRLLVEITNDPSAPLCVQRLWAHCQDSRRWEFPEMTTVQLASICRWGERKPACHVAMCKAGFVDKLSPKGFAAHDWDDLNSQLIANWTNGPKGGRPKKSKNANETEGNEKPMGFGGLTQTEPIDQIDQIDKKDKTDQTDARTSLVATASGGANTSREGGVDSSVVSALGLGGLVADKITRPFTPPTIVQVENYLQFQFAGAGQFAAAFIRSMENQRWRDRHGQPISNWQALAKSYASSAALKSRPRTLERERLKENLQIKTI